MVALLHSSVSREQQSVHDKGRTDVDNLVDELLRLDAMLQAAEQTQYNAVVAHICFPERLQERWVG